MGFAISDKGNSVCNGTRQKQRVLVRLQVFGNSCNPYINMRKARNKAGELLISGFHCQEKIFGFHLTDEDSQQAKHLLDLLVRKFLCQQSGGD